jgi:hypothetical protein
LFIFILNLMAEGTSKLLLLPREAADLPKTGIMLYVMGLVVTFLYFIQFNILSIDLIKPQSIIIGIYIWMYAILVPRSILLLLSNARVRSRLVNHALFLLILLLLYGGIFLSLETGFVTGLVVTLLVTTVQYFFHADLRHRNLVVEFSRMKTYLYLVVSVVMFAYLLFPEIPQYAAGGQPLKLDSVATKNNIPIKSRFSKQILLLYESDKDYYFFERRRINQGPVSGYSILKVSKSEIVSIRFYKAKWFAF